MPLQVLRGTVQGLTVHAGEEDFIRSETQRTVGAGAAIGLAAAGMAGAAVGASIAATGGDSVEFFSCTVSGERITGRFSKVTFKEGDEVDIVVEPQRDGTQSALAVRRPNDRTLWMFPHCSRGMRAHIRYALGMFVWICATLLLLYYCSLIVLGGRRSWGDIDIFDTLLFGTIALVMGAYFAIRFAHKWRPFVDRAEAIFATLGYRNPSRVDLEKQHKQYCKANGGKWPYLSDGPWIYRYPDEVQQ